MKVYGQLENATLEVLASDPTSNVEGRVYYNSATGRAMLDSGSAKKAFATNPMTAAGDIVYASDAAGTPARLAKNASDGAILQQVSGVPAWLGPGSTGAFLKMVGSAPGWSASGTPTRQVFTSGSGTYTTPAGVAWLRVTVVGAGGGSGGLVVNSPSWGGGIGGGGGGGCAIKTIVSPGASFTYSVGAGGSAGSSTGPTAGGNGGVSTFSDGASITLTGNGGHGSAAMTSASAAAIVGAPGPSGTALGGDLNISGGTGDYGIIVASGIGFGGHGGSSYYGQEIYGGNAAGSASANAGSFYGCGASGACRGTAGTASGAGGAAGLIVVEEYYI